MFNALISYVPVVGRFAATAPPPCPVTEVYGIPTWYKYLPQEVVNGKCQVSQNFEVSSVNNLLGIGIAFIEILLRVGALVAVGYIIYAGFTYMTSNGDPERAKSAKDTILNALIGLVITIMATVIVGFIGQRLT